MATRPTATISLTDDNGTLMTPMSRSSSIRRQNLSPESLNLTAEIMDPGEIDPRLPLGGDE